MLNKLNQWWVLGALVVFFGLLYFLSPILAPFAIAAFIAYLGNPIVNRLEKIKISRSLGALLMLILFFVFITGLVLLLLPPLEREITDLVPRFVGWVQTGFIPWFQTIFAPWLQTHFNVVLSFDVVSIKDFMMTHLAPAGHVANWFFKAISYSSSKIIFFIVDFVIMVIVSFYFMRDWTAMLGKASSLVPRASEGLVIRLARECDTTLSSFLRGQLLVIIVLATYYSIAFSLAGLPFAVLIGLLVGFFSLVPLLGAVLNFLLAGVTAIVAFHSVAPVAIIIGIIVVGYMLENFILVPWLIGKQVGLHPVAVIFAVLAGGTLFGVTGVLVAIPATAVIMVFVKEFLNRYRDSGLYKDA